jgi:hypothetical protein
MYGSVLEFPLVQFTEEQKGSEQRLGGIMPLL